jgi:hypothetical protein
LTLSKITEAKALLAEICLLKDRGLTAEAVVADFVFKNIQPLKDRVYPAYLYGSVNDSTWVTNRRIPTGDLLSRLDMILRGRVSNAGAPVAYSAWNLPPLRPFYEFVSNPLAHDGCPSHTVRPSPTDIETLISPLQSLPEDERQTHFEMPASTDDAEIDAVLSLLVGESSDSTRTELMAITTGQVFGEEVETRKPEGAHAKRSRRAKPQLHLSRRRKRGGFGDCRAWVRMSALPHQFLMMSRQRPFLRLMPRVVIVHRLLDACLTMMKRKEKKSR